LLTEQNPTVSKHPDDAPEAPTQRALGRTVGSGAVWLILATVVSKFATFAAQIAMGLILVPEHFALFSYAAAATKLLSICQDAGVKDLLVQEGHTKYERLSGPVFWFAAAFNASVAVLIASMTPLVVWFYDDPRLYPMILVLLLQIPLGTPSAILYTKLRLDLRFKATSLIVGAIGMMRQVGQICLAVAGAGEMSFIYPAVGCAAIESVVVWWISRDSPWRRPAEPSTWPSLISRTKYLILGSVANLLLDQGPYLVLQPAMRLLGGLAKAQADFVQGNVYWAFQMTAQIGVLLSYNMQIVLAPVFQRLSHDPERLRLSLFRTLGALMMLGSITSIGFGVVMDPLEKIIFQGKWQAATPAIAIYGLFFPFRILYGLTASAQLATGRVAAYFWTTLIQGSVFTLSAIAAGFFVDTPTGAAWWTGGALAVVMLGVTLHVLHDLGIRRREALVEMCWPWLLAVLAGGVGYVIDTVLPLRTMIEYRWGASELIAVEVTPVFGLWGDFVRWMSEQGYSAATQARVLHSVRFLIMGFSCAFSFAFFARLMMPDVLREVLHIVPGPLGRLGKRALLVRERE
jgi:O-antigen/teichoic acid export membrane protein